MLRELITQTTNLSGPTFHQTYTTTILLPRNFNCLEQLPIYYLNVPLHELPLFRATVHSPKHNPLKIFKVLRATVFCLNVTLIETSFMTYVYKKLDKNVRI